MNFILPMNKTIATTKGHTIEFKSGVPTHVPKECWPDVLAVGAVAEVQSAVVEKEVAKVAVPDDTDERKAAIVEAYDRMIERNTRGDFAASGVPSVKKVSSLVGFSVDVKENEAIWAEYKITNKV